VGGNRLSSSSWGKKAALFCRKRVWFVCANYIEKRKKGGTIVNRFEILFPGGIGIFSSVGKRIAAQGRGEGNRITIYEEGGNFSRRGEPPDA